MFSFYFPFFKLSFPLFVIRLVRDEEVVNAMSKKGERFDGVVCVLGVDVTVGVVYSVGVGCVRGRVEREKCPQDRRWAARISVEGRSGHRVRRGFRTVRVSLSFFFSVLRCVLFFPKTDLNFCSALGSDLSIVFLFFYFLVCQFYSLFFMGYLRIVHTFSKRVNKNTGK